MHRTNTIGAGRLTVAGVLFVVALSMTIQGSAQKTDEARQPKGLGSNKGRAALSPMKFIEYKNSHYMQPPVPAGDGGHMIRIPLTVPGTVDSARVTAVRGPGCGWTHQCPDGAKCPEPYRHPFDGIPNETPPAGPTVTWNAWSNSGENCAIYFDVFYH